MRQGKAALPQIICLFSHSLFIQDMKLDDGSFQLLHEFLALVYICGRSGWCLGFIRKQEAALQFSMTHAQKYITEGLVVKIRLSFENNKSY